METLHPGIYIQEVPGTPPVEGVSTATAGFVGIAPKGKIGEAVLVTNWSQYVKEFGGFIEDSYLAYAVRGFFENGGSRAYISRIVHFDEEGEKTSAKATAQINKEGEEDSPLFIVNAKTDGEYGNNIKVETVLMEDDKFRLNIFYKNELVDYFINLTMDTVEEMSKLSDLIEVIAIDTKGLPKEMSVTLEGGSDGLDGITDEDYVYGLSAFDNAKVTLLAMPGVTSLEVQNALIAYAEERGDAFAILEVPMSSTPIDAKNFRGSEARFDTEFGALYYPFLEVSDPIGVGKNPTKIVPPSGHIMGTIARMDNTAGVWRAPAGIDAKILGVIGLETEISDTDQDMLNPIGVNALRTIEGHGICIWGTRTLSKGDFLYIPVRRTINFIRQYLQSEMLWTTFRPNDEVLWGMIQSTVEGFLNTIWAQGGLKGESAKEAFFVKCDAELNTPEVIEQGRTYVDIGVAPQKPAEFIVFRIALNR